MIHLYTWKTPNGRKIPIMLEELNVPYRVIPVNLMRHEQFAPEFLAISPNNKIPAIIDDDPQTDAQTEKISLFESGAILTYLGEKYGRFLPASGAARYDTLAWTFWQVGGLGPMAGQLGFFEKFSKEKSPLASKRFAKETERLLGVMNRQLEQHAYLAGDDYTIADIAAYPWAFSTTELFSELLGDFIASQTALTRWLNQVGSRAAVRKGMSILAEEQSG